MQKKLTIWNKTITLDERLISEYEDIRKKLTEIHIQSLLLTNGITNNTDKTDIEIAEILTTIIREELETERQLADPEIQKKGYDMIS